MNTPGLSSATDFVSFSVGQTIFKDGEIGDRMYFILAGEVNIIVRGKVVDTAGMGGVVGEMALIDQKPRSATAAAKTDCKLIPIDQKRFMSLVSETPQFAIQVMQVMANRLRQMNAQP
jgi:CRP/FNR family transcriptional regulator, cyclic AMP receptor protein